MRTLLSAARVCGSTGGDCAVLVDGQRIQAVLDAAAAASVAADRHIDLAGATLLAGLIDAHVHLTMSAGRSHAAVWRALDADIRNARLAARAQDAARAALRAGITTIRDLGDVRGVTLDVFGSSRSRCSRDLQDERGSGGLSSMPDLLLAGPPITSPGGHLHQIGLVARGSDQTRAAAAHLVGRGVDVVSIVEVAHAAGVPVAAHALCIDSVRLSVESGVDGIEHALLRGPDGSESWDDRLVKQMARQHIWVTATLGGYLRRLLPHQTTAATHEPDAESGPTMSGRRNLQQSTLQAFWAPYARLRKAGVRVVAASDAGVRLTPISAPAGMLSLLMNGFGLSGAEALALLTREPADALGFADRGRLEQHARADLVAVDGDPTVDPSALERVRLVMCRGVVTYAERQPIGRPPQIAVRQ